MHWIYISSEEARREKPACIFVVPRKSRTLLPPLSSLLSIWDNCAYIFYYVGTEISRALQSFYNMNYLSMWFFCRYCEKGAFAVLLMFYTRIQSKGARSFVLCAIAASTLFDKNQRLAVRKINDFSTLIEL